MTRAAIDDAACPPTQWDDEIRAACAVPTATPLNIFGTLAHHPKLMKRWLVFGNHVLAKSTLPLATASC